MPKPRTTPQGTPNGPGAARAFTEQRERDIAEVQEEIALIANLGSHVKQEAFAVDIRKRILAGLQAVLSELQRGMKAEKEGK